MSSRIKPKNKKKPITITRHKLNELTDEITIKTLAIFVSTAMDEFDWTDDDLERFVIRLDRYKGAVDERLLTTPKLLEIIKRIMKVDIKKF